MGWKNVKKHYGIEGGNRIVQVVDGEIHIGVGYIQDLMKISASGELIKKDDLLNSEDFARYARAMEADPQKLRELVLASDTFEQSITVYTYDGGRILEKQCEEPGWPNVTHDGRLMYENTYSTSKAEVVEWARKNAIAGVSFGERKLAQAEADLASARAWLAEQQEDLAKLDRDFPEPASTKGKGA